MRRASLLLEVMLSIALFVGFALLVLGSLGRGADEIREARLLAQAADLTRSAMAKIEAGIESPESLDGPVSPWEDEEEPGGFADTPPDDSGWTLAIETSPSSFGDLTLVRVGVLREGRDEELHALEQLVRLRE